MYRNLRILVEEGEEIEAGQVLCVLEAMKMETEITAPQAVSYTHLTLPTIHSV